MAICWERAVPLAIHSCCFNFSAILVVRVPFPFGVWGRMWNSIVSIPDHCLYIYLRVPFISNNGLLVRAITDILFYTDLIGTMIEIN